MSVGGDMGREDGRSERWPRDTGGRRRDNGLTLADPLGRVSTGRARVLLDVVGGAATPAAQGVRLVVPLPEGGRSLRL